MHDTSPRRSGGDGAAAASRRGFCIFAALGLLTAGNAAAQRIDLGPAVAAFERDGCAEVASVRFCAADYVSDGASVEAIAFRPAGAGSFPAALLIPGYQRTARDTIPMGVRLATEGFACLAVTQPGWGKSRGKADFVGPGTIRALEVAWRKLALEPHVDPARMGIYGYSRGAMAASILATQLEDVKAAVFGAGVYDFKRAYDEVKLEGIRRNMEIESGMTDAAIRARSSILRMDRLRCPVLILHGERDVNVPVSQALLLRDRLTALGKEFEIRLYPDRDHGIGPEVYDRTLDFFKRKLGKRTQGLEDSRTQEPKRRRDF